MISEEEKATKQSEVNLLMDEVERAQTRLLSLEMEKVCSKPFNFTSFLAVYNPPFTLMIQFSFIVRQ